MLIFALTLRITKLILNSLYTKSLRTRKVVVNSSLYLITLLIKEFKSVLSIITAKVKKALLVPRTCEQRDL